VVAAMTAALTKVNDDDGDDDDDDDDGDNNNNLIDKIHELHGTNEYIIIL